jgi:hypothetical protein
MTAGRKPPLNVQVLQRWVGDLARQDGIAPARLQRWISFMVVAGLLDGARDDNLEPLFVLKGGAAMELRLGLRARATRDFDATFRDAVLNMVEALDTALRRGHGDFTASRTELEPIAYTGAQRVDIKLAYRGRSWATVQLEIAIAEGEAGREIDRLPGKPLDALGIQGPKVVPCVSVRYQIAQKLHACTESPADGRSNDRFRDLIDLLLLEELIGEDDWGGLRAACEEIFALRDAHRWPPIVTVFDGWINTYPMLATEIDFPIRDVNEAAALVQHLIERIAEATSGR